MCVYTKKREKKKTKWWAVALHIIRLGMREQSEGRGEQRDIERGREGDQQGKGRRRKANQSRAINLNERGLCRLQSTNTVQNPHRVFARLHGWHGGMFECLSVLSVSSALSPYVFTTRNERNCNRVFFFFTFEQTRIIFIIARQVMHEKADRVGEEKRRKKEMGGWGLCYPGFPHDGPCMVLCSHFKLQHCLYA